MSGRIEDLYPPVVLEHGRRPANRRIPAGVTHRASGDNPLCGDGLEIHVRMEGGSIRDIGFHGVCCAVATASASLMTTAVLGRDLEQARRLQEAFARLLAGADPGDSAEFRDLAALARIGPSRIPCVTLSWQALSSFLDMAGREARPAGTPASREQPTPDPGIAIRR